LGKLLLRRGLHYAGRNWTRAHRQWIDGLAWTHAAERAVVDDYLLAIDHTEARLLELDARLAETAEHEPYRRPVGWLRCFRGIDTLTAMLILAELHDFRRFASAPALMAYLGLVPGEDSSGEKHRRGRITRTGNALVRRLLVETAWHYQHRPSVGVALKKRRAGQPGRVIAIADKAQQRLCRRFRKLAAAHKPAPKIAVAVRVGSSDDSHCAVSAAVSRWGHRSRATASTRSRSMPSEPTVGVVRIVTAAASPAAWLIEPVTPSGQVGSRRVPRATVSTSAPMARRFSTTARMRSMA